MPDYRVSGKDEGGVWVKSGAIRGGNRRKPVFGFLLLGERLFCKGLIRSSERGFRRPLLLIEFGLRIF